MLIEMYYTSILGIILGTGDRYNSKYMKLAYEISKNYRNHILKSQRKYDNDSAHKKSQ